MLTLCRLHTLRPGAVQRLSDNSRPLLTQSEGVTLVLQRGSGGGLERGKRKLIRQQYQTGICGCPGRSPGPCLVGAA